MNKEIEGFGTKPNGEKVDINSPEFRLQDYESVTIKHEMTVEEAQRHFPHSFQNYTKI